jgi:hypothetical protein
MDKNMAHFHHFVTFLNTVSLSTVMEFTIGWSQKHANGHGVVKYSLKALQSYFIDELVT